MRTHPPESHMRRELGNRWPGDAKELESRLKEVIEGEVRFDAGTRAIYSTDSSNYRQIPIGAVIPKSIGDVEKTLAVCRKFGAPVLSRGGGTSLAGQCCNVAVVMDFSKYLRNVLELNADEKFARVQPGTVLDDVRAAGDKYNLTFPPDPSTHNHCTIGGMIGNNSCGVHSVMGGKTVDNLAAMEILTYDGLRMWVGPTPEADLNKIIQEGGRRGQIYERMKKLRDKYGDLIRKKYPKIPRRVSGYNLDQLLPENGFHVGRALVGSEGTLVTVLEAKLQLMHNPPDRCLLILGYPDVFCAGDHVMEVLAHGPVGLEGLDDNIIKDLKRKKIHLSEIGMLPEGNGFLLVEFGGDTRGEASDKAQALMEQLRKVDHPPPMKLYDDPENEKTIWDVREGGLGATTFIPGHPLTWEGWEDSAVPPDKVGDYLRDLRELLNKYHYTCALYGHFGDGCIHTRIEWDLKTKDGIEHYKSFVRAGAHLVARYGGSISGEHGDGQSKAELLPIMFGEELIEAFREFKNIWDPQNKMNPGKVVDAFRNDENLRLGVNYNPWVPETRMHFQEDHGDFSRTSLRCVGVGKCRRETGGTMCPSYMVTKEEKHSTRGRTHLLFEMLQGEVIKDGWKSEEVREALDLCLACKGCLSDCPVNVDMASYKAEFLSHYYEGRLRPRHAYAMGLIHIWARVASHIPRLVNFLGRAPGIGALVKWMGGISQKRSMPQFATETFRAWWNKREAVNKGKPRVMLWVDTFNNYFHPNTLKAATEVLEIVGYQVILPREHLCCGRALYDFGMIDHARKMLEEVVISLRDTARAEIPIVGLEPSCVAVFRDEMGRQLPFNEDAKRVTKLTMTLSEFLMKHAKHVFPRLSGQAVIHGHCHHKAVMKMDCERELLKCLGLEFEMLESGCCGMAGSFGFEADKYDVSVACGERILLPAVREAREKKIIVADGFSCHEQIEQLANHRPMHMAELVLKALREGNFVNPVGKEVHPKRTIPEMQEQSSSFDPKEIQAVNK